jgi:hypothetical protein
MELLKIEGEYYVKKIFSVIKNKLNEDKDLLLKFKIIHFLLQKETGTAKHPKEMLTQIIKLRDSYNGMDKGFVDDLNDKLLS